MKKGFSVLLLAFAVALFALPHQLQAQALDTLVLAANPIQGSGPTIDQVIAGDTTSDGHRINPNRVYVLQQTGPIDTVYFWSATIYSKFKLTIIGKVNPITGMLPVIAPAYYSNGASPKEYVDCSADLTIKNLYVLFKNVIGVSMTGDAFPPVADSVTIRADHCVFDGQAKNTIFYLRANWDKLFVTNCEFRNFQYATPGQGGVSWSSGTVPSDSMVFINNTIFCIDGQLVGGPGYHRYVRVEHNTMFMCGGGAITSRQITNAIVKDNIFFGLSVTGADTNSYVNQSYEGSFIGDQVFGFDSLVSLRNAGLWGNPFMESDRHITIENNAYFWPPALTNYILTLKSDTGSTITPPVWMNRYVTAMFTNKTTWPNNIAQNNINVDPGFTASIVGSTVDTLMLYTSDIWNGGGTSGHYWGQYMDDPYTVYLVPNHEVSSDWASTQGYPVPENLAYSMDLQSAGTDGFALGDLNWYPDQLKAYSLTAVQQVHNEIPAKFALSQNYPNPFNPTTRIEYSVPQNEFVSLKVYNVLGQEVATLFEGTQRNGNYSVTFDGSKLASGVYIYRLQSSEGASIAKKLVLMK